MSNYLYHHGVKGQRWGVRRYQNSDGSLTAAGKSRYYTKEGDRYSRSTERAGRAMEKHTAKMETSKTRLGKDYHNYMATVNAATVARNQKANDSGNFVGRYNNRYGTKALATNQEQSSIYYENKAKYDKTAKQRQRDISAAYNMQQYSKVNNNVANAKGYINKSIEMNKDFWNTPYKTSSGRETTRGRLYLESAISAGIITAVKDASYTRASKKNGTYGDINQLKDLDRNKKS